MISGRREMIGWFIAGDYTLPPVTRNEDRRRGPRGFGPRPHSASVTRYSVTRYGWRSAMAAAAERMKMMRQRRRARGLRELRLVVPDPRSRAVRRRVAKQVAGLDLNHERDAL